MAADNCEQYSHKEDKMEKYEIYKDGKLKKTYDSEISAFFALAIAKDAHPEATWELKTQELRKK